MRNKNRFYCITCCLLLSITVSCSTEKEVPLPLLPPKLLSIVPGNGEKDVSISESQMILHFNENVTLKIPHDITLNNVLIRDIKPGIEKELRISLPALKPSTEYTLCIPPNTIKGASGQFIASEIKLIFTTITLPERGFSVQAKKLMEYLRSVYGKKTISGAMANVSWNIHEAEWVHKHTGRYPAINCFDFIFHPFSPTNWINYNDISVVENWWNANGLVAAMWHWNVPGNSGEKDKFSFYYGTKTEETLFDVSKITDINSNEYKRIMKDIDEVSAYLILLKAKQIPVIWRPLHEAAGNTNVFPGGKAWFWWGAKGAEPFKKLWKLMFERMTNYHNLNNLIWVWTSENNDSDWYPGDEYVDIIGRDLYNFPSATNAASEFIKLSQKYADKMIALSECGSVSPIIQQWNTGAKWLWFMPWYDYERTNNPQEIDFEQTVHKHAAIDWWKSAFSSDFVISREQVPNLK